MIQSIWIIWITFLVDQAGLIHKLTYLDVTWILTDHKLLRKIHWHLLSKWTLGQGLGQVNALNQHWCKATLLPQAVLKLWCPEILFSWILCMGLHQFCILPRMKGSAKNDLTSSASCQEWYETMPMALFHICRFYLCHFT